MSKILFATDAWHPQVNGVVRTIQRTSEELMRRGHEMLWVTPSDFRTLPMPGYREIRLALATRNKVRGMIEQMQPDFVHIATEGPIGFATRNACLADGISFTTSYHTKFPEYVAARLPVPVDMVYALLRRFHNSARSTLIATEGLSAELKERGFTRIRPWARGVDLDRFSPAKKIDLDLPRPIFAYVGRIAVEKSVEDFLKLDLPGSKLVVGDGPQRRELERRYPQAHFTGYAQGDALAGLYATADVVVFPSRTDTFGLVVIEALASGTPVAAYPVMGPKDILEGSGAGVLDEDLQVACKAALSIGSARCVAHASRFTWESATDLFLAALQDEAPVWHPQEGMVAA